MVDLMWQGVPEDKPEEEIPIVDDSTSLPDPNLADWSCLTNPDIVEVLRDGVKAGVFDAPAPTV